MNTLKIKNRLGEFTNHKMTRQLAKLAKLSLQAFFFVFIVWVMFLPFREAMAQTIPNTSTGLDDFNAIVSQNEIYLTDPIECNTGDEYRLEILIVADITIAGAVIPNNYCFNGEFTTGNTGYNGLDDYYGQLKGTQSLSFEDLSGFPSARSGAIGTDYENYYHRLQFINQETSEVEKEAFVRWESTAQKTIIEEPEQEDNPFAGLFGTTTSAMVAQVRRGVQDTTEDTLPIGAAVVGVPIAFYVGRLLLFTIRSSV